MRCHAHGEQILNDRLRASAGQNYSLQLPTFQDGTDLDFVKSSSKPGFTTTVYHSKTNEG